MESVAIKVVAPTMLDIIENNPYRLLGVYSNSPTKERVSNLNRLKAFLKVGKPVPFPSDLSAFLPPINRTIENVKSANANLALPNDQLRYAQFWFVKATTDDIAMNYLIAGNMDNAIAIWEKKENASSLQNRIVCSLIRDDYATALAYAATLYSTYAADFVTLVLGANQMVVASDLDHVFLDELCATFGAQQLLPYLPNRSWKQYVGDKIVPLLIDALQSAFDAAKATRGAGIGARLAAGKKLMKESKAPLAQLKTLLSENDLQYQMIADKIAQEILQCGIDYFNGSDADEALHNAEKLQNYALSIAVGQLVKDRCKANVAILKKIAPEYAVRKELEQLAIYIKYLRNEKIDDVQKTITLGLFGRGISDITRIVDKSIPLLDSMKTKLGYTNTLYVDVSSAVVSAAVNALVEVVNTQQRLLSGSINNLRYMIKDATILMAKLGRRDMDAKTRNYYNGNKSTLDSISNRLNYVPPTIYVPPTKQSEGCYIATMVYGDYNHPQVMVLRRFRDDYLAKRNWGQNFIKFYYKYSPKLVTRLKNHKGINHAIRILLDRFVTQLKQHNF